MTCWPGFDLGVEVLDGLVVRPAAPMPRYGLPLRLLRSLHPPLTRLPQGGLSVRHVAGVVAAPLRSALPAPLPEGWSFRQRQGHAPSGSARALTLPPLERSRGQGVGAARSRAAARTRPLDAWE